MLKPIDLTVLIFLVSAGAGEARTQQDLALALGISQSSVHRALGQLRVSGLLVGDTPQYVPLRNLIVHGVRHVYPAVLGQPARGLPTAWSSGALGDSAPSSGHALVWPLDGAEGMGTSVRPLHPCVPAVAARFPPFHELMSLVDAIRVGRVRDRELATSRLDQLLLARRAPEP